MTAATGPERGPGGVRTLVLDVLGTVVDEAGSIQSQVMTALAAAGEDPAAGPELAARWTAATEAHTERIAAGQAPWRPNDEVRRAALLEAVAGDPGPAAAGGGQAGAGRAGTGQAGPALGAAALAELALAGHRLAPWPDSGPALRALARSYTVVALSNASLAQLTDMFGAGGLTWHCVLSSELARTYKPDPAVYRLALALLGLDPAATMMVAAHPWDLRAAAGHGLRTAYVTRPGEGVPEPGDRFDVRAAGLAELAARLTGTAQPGTGPAGAQPGTGPAGAQPGTGPAGAQPGTGPAGTA